MNPFGAATAAAKHGNLDGSDTSSPFRGSEPYPRRDWHSREVFDKSSAMGSGFNGAMYPHHKGRCYHFIMTFHSCRSRAYEEQQCRPARDDLDECILMGKHRSYLQRQARYTASIPWDEVRMWFALMPFSSMILRLHISIDKTWNCMRRCQNASLPTPALF